MIHRVYFSPGMFGFGQLASYDYFAHLERAIIEKLRAVGDDAETFVVDVAPTASIRRRAARLADMVCRTCDDHPDDAASLVAPPSMRSPGPWPSFMDSRGGPIHLVGHSTGGLDARMVASPDIDIGVEPETLAWMPRLASITTISTPHYGTPLASFFATVSGQRLLYSLSALTFIALSIGSPPLSAVSALVMTLSRLDRALGLDVKLLDSVTDSLLRVLSDAQNREVRSFLDAITQDQGAMIQLMPESMEIFRAGITDRPGVKYQCTASMAPPPTPMRFVKTLRNPWRSLSTAIFATIHRITSRFHEAYPCAAPYAGDEVEATLARVFGRAPGARANDGVVPLRSQLWGELVWAGHADHLDILGHFSEGTLARGAKAMHFDWLASGAEFDKARFDAMVTAITKGMLASSVRFRTVSAV